MAAGAGLRALALLAYPRPFLFYDSYSYLANAEHLVPRPVRPLGYAAWLWLLPLGDGLTAVAVVQHLMGLLIAGALYVLLLRLNVRPLIAALAVVPVLLDAYQIDLEHYVLAETLFELLIVAAAIALLWRRPARPIAIAFAGALLAAAALTRASGLTLILPALLAALFTGVGWRRAALMAGCFAVPVLAYMAAFDALHGSFSLTGFEGRFLYGRVAPFADCSAFAVPRDERPLCPRQPPGRRASVSAFTWSRRSPVHRLRDPHSPLIAQFARRVILHQPLDYAAHVATDMGRGFALTRTRHPGEPPIAYWQFPLTWRVYVPPGVGARARGARGHVRRQLASALRSYQLDGGYTPGPLMAAALFVGALAVAGVAGARGSGLRAPALLFCGLGIALLATSMAVATFSWRYWIPELVLMPPAGAIGITALTQRRSPPQKAIAQGGNVVSDLRVD